MITNSHNENRKPQELRVSLDSGSDGDLLFVHEGTKTYIPFKERYAPQKWRTSNGVFTTTKVGNMEVQFPAFSSSKRFTFKPDVVTVPKSAPPHIYDLIIGIKSFANIGAILDFATYNLTLDNVELPMRPFDSLIDHKDLSNMLQEHLEPKSTAETTHRAVEILDASYVKADLSSIVNECCKHLTTDQCNKLLRLLLNYEVLFDGSL